MMSVLARFWVALIGAGLITSASHAAGTLTPTGSPTLPIEIRDHHVEVVINNGFSKTRVAQSFYNPNPEALEGIYAFPIPKQASLSEMRIYAGEETLEGEVVPRSEAERIYQAEKDAGNEAGLGSKHGFQRFAFHVANIPAQAETRMEFVYYQPIEIDTGVGRYLYPLEEGGTDELAKSFWLINDKVTRNFSIDVELRSAVPIESVRAPGYEAAAKLDQHGAGHYRIRVDSTQGSLGQDFLVYYKLSEDQPPRIDLLPYRPDPDEPGHFMLILTPGVELAPLDMGADYVLVLDTSGSMQGKLGTLVAGVRKAIGELRPQDRFRIVTFSERPRAVVDRFTPATAENVAKALAHLDGVQHGGSTNIYEGLQAGLDDLDADRVTSIILVTDGVTNTGIVDPRAFYELMKKTDVRVFGFLMGNSANWPLMRIVCEASGGFYSSVSNADDILGQILLAKSKITHAAMHDVEIDFDGVRTFDTTGRNYCKVYRGQQLVLFGRYEEGGDLDLEFRMRVSGEDRTLSTTFELPEIASDYPEIERLFGLAHIREIEDRRNAGVVAEEEAVDAIEDLGIAYQLVTDETSMLVLSDTAFDSYGIDRRNRERAASERAAQAQRATQPIASTRVDRRKPLYTAPAPSLGGGRGEGSFGPAHGLGALVLAVLAERTRRRNRRVAKGDDCRRAAEHEGSDRDEAIEPVQAAGTQK